MMSPQMQRAVQLLADGGWHDREPIVREISKLITPGRAYREMESARRSARGAKQERVRERSTDFLVKAGQRRIALLSLNRARRLQRRVLDGVVQIRITPSMDPARDASQGEGDAFRAG